MTGRCVSIGVAILAVACGIARADSIPASQPPQAPVLWAEDKVRDSAGQLYSCMVTRIYSDGVGLSFGLTRASELFLVVSRPTFTPPPDWQGELSLTVDKGLQHAVPATEARGNVLLDLSRGESVQVLLRTGNWLQLSDVDDRPFSLSGLEAELQWLNTCVAAESGRGTAAAPAAATAAATEAAPLSEPASSDIWVELGTYDEDANAKIDAEFMWRTLRPLLDKYAPRLDVSVRTRDGRKFTLLRATGFANRDEAMQLCRLMQAKKRECAPH